MPTEKANIARHNYIRLYPNRKKMVLRQAITATGLEVVGWEYEVTAPWGKVWYDAAVKVYDQIGLIFLADILGMPQCSGNPFNTRARQRKLTYARDNHIPFLEVWPTTQLELEAHIELWVMMLRRMPQVEASHHRPKRVKILKHANTVKRRRYERG